jgi:ribosomal protein S1
MADKKRTRIGKKNVQPTIKEQEAVQTQGKQATDTVENWLTDEGEFDWDAYQASCVTHIRTPNPHIKTLNGERVFSRESYAQEMYDAITGHSSMSNMRSTVDMGEIVDGKIFNISEEWMSVDVNYREMVYVKLSKEPKYIIEEYKPGDEVSVLINSKEDQILGSISGGMKQRVFMDLRAGVEDGDTAWVGKVTYMIENGGYIVDIQGVECFMPGSLAGINKLHDFNSIVGKEIYVVPVSFSIERGTIVVSHRKYLKALIPSQIESLKADIENKQSGEVTGTAKYGVFVEFNTCLTGMIHVNDLDEATMAKFKAREIKPGDPVEFWIKDIISNSKITLSQKAETINNPWKDIEKKFKVPCNIEATVKTKKDYGLFITVDKGLVGLLHVSELDESVMDLYNPGDKITVQVNRIDKDSQKIFLKLPE